MSTAKKSTTAPARRDAVARASDRPAASTPATADASALPPTSAPLADSTAAATDAGVAPTDTSQDVAARPASATADPDLPQIRPLPGSGILGRGIYIRPRQPYELKDYLFVREPGSARIERVSNSPQPYLVAPDCEVNNSPPLPTDRATGQTIIEESWNRFGREVTVNINAAANAKALSIDATSFQGSSLKVEEDSYYALRSSFIPFWSVYMPRADSRNVIAEFAQLNLPHRHTGQASELSLPEGPFNPLRRADYARVFNRFGTHCVKSVWLGGKASLAFVVTKSSNLSREEVKAGVETAFGSVAKTGLSEAQTQAQDRVRNNSSCNVFGSGGDPTELAKLTKLDAEQYDTWINSVKQNPEVIELGVVGIWTLLTDRVKAEALRQAYVQESTFTPLNAVVPFRDWLVFVKSDETFDYSLTLKYGPSRLYLLSCLFRPTDIKDPIKLRDRLVPLFEGATDRQTSARFVQAATRVLPHSEELSEIKAESIQKVADADLPVFLAGLLNVLLLGGESLRDQPFFKKLIDKTVLSPRTQELLDHGDDQAVGAVLHRLLLEDIFPTELARRPTRLSVTSYLPLLEDYPDFAQPHAAFSLRGFGKALDDKLYLFRWRRCLRIDLQTETVDEGYPTDISEDWPEVDFDRIDAAVAFAPNRIYFFRGNEYIRIDIEDGEHVATTRDLIKDRWPGVTFDQIDTAAYWGSNKIYFFSGDQYIRYDFSSHRADPGYPKFLTSDYVEDWEIFE
ncbi:hemopexin repeat-containing protein [Variovorax sp. J22R115]|uniref:hemopexin repeat-containing protein n=1 Tax=Variovorax sp. J22R115 TaxID=3053509 RepID=UPI002577C7B1|nr:hemopexin repeat-containing protein [Variovorax sp. J22R115]MDM0053048.1 hemopexin repeat-containing protein [Variovorax sp. J22R115]